MHGCTIEEWRAKPHPGRALAEALHIHEESLCGGCGHPLAETTDPDRQHAWEAPPPVRCHACTARDLQAEKYEDARAPRALRFPVLLNPKRIRRRKEARRG